jgi:hypothetical protein
MFTTYTALNANIKKAIRNHLMEVDALPPTMALSELAGEITDVVFAELSNIGITKETIETVARDRVLTKVARTAA